MRYIMFLILALTMVSTLGACGGVHAAGGDIERASGKH